MIRPGRRKTNLSANNVKLQKTIPHVSPSFSPVQSQRWRSQLHSWVMRPARYQKCHKSHYHSCLEAANWCQTNQELFRWVPCWKKHQEVHFSQHSTEVKDTWNARQGLRVKSKLRSSKQQHSTKSLPAPERGRDSTLRDLRHRQHHLGRWDKMGRAFL